MKNIPRLPKNLFDGVADDVVVVDTGNYYPQQRDGRIDPIEQGTTESRWVATQLRRPVVKAFNNIYAQHLLERGKPRGDPDRIALPVAGDDQRAKDVVIRLLDQIGFDGVDAGGLDESWRQQPGTPVYGTDHARSRGPKSLGRGKTGADFGLQGRRGGSRWTSVAVTDRPSTMSALPSRSAGPWFRRDRTAWRGRPGRGGRREWSGWLRPGLLRGGRQPEGMTPGCPSACSRPSLSRRVVPQPTQPVPEATALTPSTRTSTLYARQYSARQFRMVPHPEKGGHSQPRSG